ncbi:MAG: homoserine O-succinyltransferase [Firmicutes bacterium]|nr:homoserine O-succinyltransferase [Bacillota bacterium]
MPIKVPNNLPAVEILTKENVFVMTDTRAMTQDIRPLQILILNLMPTKVETETQLTRLLGNSPLQVELELLQASSHKAKNVSQEHMIAFYKTFDQVRDKYYDGMIITGAPVELMEFEQVEYWDELCEIMEWSKTHVHSTFHICWGAQAGLYYHYGIKKRVLPEKKFGVFLHTLEYKTGMLFRGFDDEFYVPHSRYTGLDEEAVFSNPNLRVISTSSEAGIFAVKSVDDKQIFITGHSEYDGDTLEREYIRDLAVDPKTKIPYNYFPEDDPSKEPQVSWRSCANLLYSNWLNYFVYQSTPFDLNDIKTGNTPKHELVTDDFDLITVKFGGSSLADAGQFKKVADIVKSDARRRFVVASAPGKRNSEDIKITDLLLKARAAGGNTESDEYLNLIEERYKGIADELGIEFDVESEVDQIRKKLSTETAEELLDYVPSRGEYIGAKLLAKYMGFDFIDAGEFIKFDDEGNYDKETTERILGDELFNHEFAVIPGFYGSMPDGKIKTFSRGGSDITGAIVAASTGSDLYENWTDVSGLLMADPRIVEKPVSVPLITYRELRELSYLGAEVLHADTVFQVASKGIPINIKNTNSPSDAGTLIVNNARYYSDAQDISGLSGAKGYMSVTVQLAHLNENANLREKVLDSFAEKGIKIETMMTGVDSMTFLVKESFKAAVEEAISEIKNTMEGAVAEVVAGLAMIGVVGRDMGTSPNIAIKILSALAALRINIKFLDHGVGNLHMILAVDEKDYENAIRAIYQQFA